MSSFTTHFWGDRNNGFDVLYQNMKAGSVSSRELEEYFRESCSVEESYVKLQMKLAKMAANYGNRGSFGPFWQALKVLSEKLSCIHLQLSQSWQDLIKEVHKYTQEQQKKQREVKDQEVTTVDAVQAIQHTLGALQKAKEVYHARFFECEKLKRDAASQRELEKAEAKLKKSNEDYRNLLEKYTQARNDFIFHMTASCKRFQENEEKHLQQMKEFIDSFSKARDAHCTMLAQVQEQFKVSCSDLSVQKLIEMVVQSKTTGVEKPGTIEYMEPDVSNLTTSMSMFDIDKKEVASSDVKHKNQIGGILSIPMKYRNQRKKNKELSDKEKDKSDSSSKNAHLVDEEGYSIRPENVQNSRDSFDSSSDNESDVEDKISKIKVEIKPKASPPASDLNDLKNIVQSFKLHEIPSRRTPVNEGRSVNHSLDSCIDSFTTSTNTTTHNSTPTRPSDDLINLDLFESQSADRRRPGLDSSAPPPPVKQGTLNSTNSSSSLSSAVAAAATTSERNSPFSSSKPTAVASSSTTPPLIPAPMQKLHSRPHHAAITYTATARPAGRQTPDVFRLLSSDRSESLLSLNSFFSTVPQNISTTPSYMSGGILSRGPSPLTLAMSDVIPVAVAFSETVDALFRGTDQSRCQVRIMGSLAMSFPGGIMRVFLENPNPQTLSFRVKNASLVDNFFVNKQLLIENESLRTNESRTFSFDMPSVVEHLRKQSEANKSAKYFNVDVLKYQVKVRDPPGDHVPLKLTSYWKSEPNQLDYKLDYSYQSSCMSPLSLPLTNLQMVLQLDPYEEVTMQSLPPGTWSKDSRQVSWKLPDISDMSENGSSSSIKAKFDVNLSSTSSSHSNMAAFRFLCEGATLSGLDFELASSGYRLSLTKKRFFSGKYLSEPEIVGQKTEGS